MAASDTTSQCELVHAVPDMDVRRVAFPETDAEDHTAGGARNQWRVVAGAIIDRLMAHL